MRSPTLLGVFLVVAIAACGGAQKAAPAPPPQAVDQPEAPFDPTHDVPGGSGGESDDGVQVTGTQGTLDADEVTAAIEDHWTAISHCYTSVIGGRYYLAGSMTLKVRVQGDGSVKTAEVEQSDLGSYETERCILGVVQAVRFPKPRGGPEAELTYPVQFPTRSAIVTWDASHVASAVSRQQKKAMAACPGVVPPSLLATVYVGPGGQVESVGLSAEGELDDTLAECLVGQVQTWTLPDPKGSVVKVQLPLD